MHGRGVFDFNANVPRYQQYKLGWIKLVSSETEYLNILPELFRANITPIVRMYLPQIGNAPPPSNFMRSYDAYIDAGVQWFELYNEPNLGIEWPNGIDPDWRDMGLIRPMMDNWLDWAEYLVSRGAYPGFISLAETPTPQYAAVRWMDAMLNDMANRHYTRFLNVLRSGMYCPTHPYFLNHYYQEPRGGPNTAARPPESLRAGEGGWHFEYPYDPRTQADDPGRTVFGGTPGTPYGDPVGLIAMGRMVNERCQALFGTQAIPIIGTEGGIWDFPGPGDPPLVPDTRFPPITHYAHGEATVAMFDWIAQQAPPWMFGVCLWKDDIYLEKGGSALARLSETPAPIKTVPPINVMLDGSSPVMPVDVTVLRGPGPVHGAADFHLLVLDDNLTPEWFFETARNYWERFRPVLTTDLSFLEYTPYAKSMAVTVLIRTENRAAAEALFVNYPNAYLDIIEVTPDTTLALVNRVFEVRVERGLRFG